MPHDRQRPLWHVVNPEVEAGFEYNLGSDEAWRVANSIGASPHANDAKQIYGSYVGANVNACKGLKRPESVSRDSHCYAGRFFETKLRKTKSRRVQGALSAEADVPHPHDGEGGGAVASRRNWAELQPAAT
ncbi:hypothetical protein BESB_017260 [Besnoitia besnoiti]|uniref:Uncharacterized protein n=1 Tax=Besnoitia besnoiti TaxID=94643 RepID=A0A2A9M1N4_BESBE|nr:hypothetical protein BESB_017260 [Besnoitia besnoiti]PFH32408.1 hypothetical protein BESB_017260 [Besnoitia besnoiti]